nr:hypothetical protein [uncultured Psychroserpens sp.]
MKTIYTLISFLLFTIIGFTQNGINYKALIKDNNGNVVASASIDIKFTIYEGQSLTNNVYQEDHTINTDSNGFVIAGIGTGTTSVGNFATIDWGSHEHFLNVQVDIGSGMTDIGTTQFMAVPYALSSGDHPWSKNDNGVHTLNDNVGINSDNPEHTLDVRSISQAEPSGFNLSNSDKSRYLRFFSGSDMFPDPSVTLAPGRNLLFASFDDNTFEFNEYMRISSQGDIGIGITDPEARLDIKGGDWNLDAGNPGDLRIGSATNNFRIGVATGGGGAGITRLYTNSNDLILGTNDSPVLKLGQNGSINAPSMTNEIIENAGSKSLITKEYADNLISNNNIEKIISIPASAFAPSISTTIFRILSGVRAYCTEGNSHLYAPLILPKGSVVHEISAFILDNDPINDLSFSVGRIYELAYGGVSLVFPALTTANNSIQVQVLTHSTDFTISEVDQYSIRIHPPTGHEWSNGLLSALQVKVTYTEP